ncbi:M20 family metallo-hydrolase [Streptomyces sp. NPDC006430]|uniref:M20 family metallo-hydrolase n=1 Tax=Streptomyces sp. NPDC006430 TaxID=3154299 RepID=UPI0033B60BEC
MRISGSRLLADLAELATFGGREDGGVDRLAGSPEDIASRAWLARRIEDAGLEAWTDDVGNVFGRRYLGEGPWLLIGSHTDTVPAGGRLDGAYGVIAALEVLRTLHEADHPAAARLEIVDFWDEEGAQPSSTGGLVGSTALSAGGHAADIVAFLELHIEQGPRMDKAGLELAAVDGIVGIERHMVTMRGEPNHAGTTPMAVRADAGRAAVKVADAVWDIACDVDKQMVANVGCIEFHPGAPNVIPGEASLVVEFRAAAEASLGEAAARLSAEARRAAEGQRCSVEVTRLSHKPVVRFDEVLVDTVDRVCGRTGVPAARMPSFAGHDAGAMSARVPTAMLFVPSTGGVSHSPAEDTPDQLLVQGAQVLLDAVVEYCGSWSYALGRRR